MKQKSIAERLFSGVNISLLLVISAVMLFPFLYLFSVSFSSFEDFLGSKLLLWPSKWTTDAYEYIWASRTFRQALLNTSLVTVLGTIVNLFFTATMAYALSRPIVGQRTVMFMVVFALLFSAGMIPTYLVVQETGLLDSIWSLILPVAIAPFNLIVIRQFFMNIPSDMIEAGIVDGANDLQIFGRIILPLSKPALAAFSLFYAVTHWNNYFAPILYINDPAKWTIQVVLRQIVVVGETTGTLGGDNMFMDNPPPPETIQMAAILMATLPILIVYPFLQKHFAKGVMLGAVKG
ncbi:carbohydrate ABC transporter permease [Paenibacillus sp. FSL H8-0457]|uniref:carbohydrate ABC transporter permease n=1 Tax=Bacillales TaxID=1385 RepID=UPI000178A00C|nr:MULTISPECIES: carbohydrate ABC transporter permease [Paenibacillus]ACX65666.1 binding-protein-dependent transport systems inner membrane component [Paenibacillus sp. Y412MC10]ETT66910.1 binding-protein-dependent transport systems inner membrane component [Paenibacillus sp. FSL H8-457]MCM3258133.1 carbohydrate ABC transporter permease [Paenibacillus lautus]QOT12089.1 carbohydrate ABC transporter permease [Paenibacillus sp. JNUCC-32]WFB55830.1 carbohydrate ABC transporter permease [Paenibacil